MSPLFIYKSFHWQFSSIDLVNYNLFLLLFVISYIEREENFFELKNSEEKFTYNKLYICTYI